MTPTFFPTSADFRTWLAENHHQETELLVGFYKVGSRKPSMTWSQSVDEALCFGWIDGVRRSVDADSYCIRFTPRKPKSIWSAVNMAKIEALTQQGLMHPAGVAAFAKREESKSKIYTYEQKNEIILSADFDATFKANEDAWTFFQKQAPWYKKQMINWIMSAKQLATQLSRLDKLIRASAEERKL
ncbi:YdeI/OmpD-associated family protein [Spirosoma litoris]